MTRDWRAFPDAIDALKGLLEWPDGTLFSDEEIDRIVTALRGLETAQLSQDIAVHEATSKLQ